jgi:serine protease inhibitor
LILLQEEWQQEKTSQLTTYLNKLRDYEKMDVSEVDFNRRIKAQPKEQYVKQFVAVSPKTLSRTKSK